MSPYRESTMVKPLVPHEPRTKFKWPGIFGIFAWLFAGSSREKPVTRCRFAKMMQGMEASKESLYRCNYGASQWCNEAYCPHHCKLTECCGREITPKPFAEQLSD
jgi:hypothetical protein